MTDYVDDDDVFVYDANDTDADSGFNSNDYRPERLDEKARKHILSLMGDSEYIVRLFNMLDDVDLRIERKNVEVHTRQLEYEALRADFDVCSSEFLLNEVELFDEDEDAPDCRFSESAVVSSSRRDDVIGRLEQCRVDMQKCWDDLSVAETERNRLYGERDKILFAVIAQLLVHNSRRASSEINLICGLRENSRNLRSYTVSDPTPRGGSCDSGDGGGVVQTPIYQSLAVKQRGV